VLAVILLMFVVFGRKHLKRHGVWYLFLLPSLIGMIVFLAYPIAESFRLSLFRSNGFLEMYSGLDNYTKVLKDPTFHKSLYNTLYIGLIGLVLGIPIGFVLASLINSQKKAQAAFKMLYFLPMVTSVIASVIIFKYLFEPDFGIVNAFLNKLHIPTEGLVWLNSPQTSKMVVVLFSLWQGIGYTILICLSGLQAIPDQLYEAASIDGCNGLKKWWHITLPNMRPTFVFLFMTGCIGALKRFEDVFTLGGMQGSPAGSLRTSVGYIFEQAFGIFNFGTASAAAYLLFALILVITLVNYRVMLRKEM
jgi:ABC-type sugar transport system permease subunit